MKKRLGVILILCALMLSVLPAAAADYPNKPITAYIPLSAGGTSDVFVRTIAPYMEKYLGKSLVLVNKPGSGGAVAISTLAKAKPDGYTFSWANLPTLATIPQMRKLTYNPKELVYIGSPMHYDYLLYVKRQPNFLMSTWPPYCLMPTQKSGQGELRYAGYGDYQSSGGRLAGQQGKTGYEGDPLQRKSQIGRRGSRRTRNRLQHIDHRLRFSIQGRPSQASGDHERQPDTADAGDQNPQRNGI